jgi:hypothetical protein
MTDSFLPPPRAQSQNGGREKRQPCGVFRSGREPRQKAGEEPARPLRDGGAKAGGDERRRRHVGEQIVGAVVVHRRRGKKRRRGDARERTEHAPAGDAHQHHAGDREQGDADAAGKYERPLLR